MSKKKSHKVHSPMGETVFHIKPGKHMNLKRLSEYLEILNEKLHNQVNGVLSWKQKHLNKNGFKAKVWVPKKRGGDAKRLAKDAGFKLA